MFIILSKLGFEPYIVGKRFRNHNISFIQNLIRIRIINKTFSEIKKDDYDILIVNSDQTWRKWNNYFYDIAFLKFAQKWNKIKFVYGASLGVEKWSFTKADEKIAKYLIRNFTGISVREKGSIKKIKDHLGIKPLLVLDPTFLIDIKYYIKIIKNYKRNIKQNDNFIFSYTVTNSKKLKRFIRIITENNHYKIKIINIHTANQIEEFLYGIYNCKAVITDSFHGTVFSIIFNKPFISFLYKKNGIERFNSLKSLFNIGDRIYDLDSIPDANLLETPLNINKTVLNILKEKSINFIKRNLNI